MQSLINWILKIIKWPIALFMLAILLPSVFCLILFVKLLIQSEMLSLFFFPLLAFCAFWVLFLRGKGTSFFAIFEHEITHMLFAVLTFHKPVSLEVHHHKGGSFNYQGKGNWLICLAPYFFPTFPVIVMLGSILYPFMNTSIPNGIFVVLGLATGYHICTTIASIHPKQTDFKEAGFLFSILFLPTANILCYGLIAAFALYQWNGLILFANTLNESAITFMNEILINFLG